VFIEALVSSLFHILYFPYSLYNLYFPYFMPSAMAHYRPTFREGRAI